MIPGGVDPARPTTSSVGSAGASHNGYLADQRDYVGRHAALSVGESVDNSPPESGRAREASRISWLDGVRACAALFVVWHHIWLAIYPGYPRITGPVWLGWLLYGHFAVVVFIVVSGYSLSLVPSHQGYQLPGGPRGFARRRAWRILPPYWAALLISMAMVVTLLAPRGETEVTGKTLLVHGLLLQDIVYSPSPNSAYWSIAVEAQIYILFPLLLWTVRRRGPLFTAGIATCAVCVCYVLAVHVSALSRILNFTPQLLIAFVFGMTVAGLRRAPTITGRRLPIFALAAVCTASAIVVFNRVGSVAVIHQLFWTDIAVAIIVALLFWGLSTQPTAILSRMLANRHLAFIGSFSYSIYLIHAPFIALFWLYIVRPMHVSAVMSFTLLTFVGIPIIVLISYFFFVLFERPFLRIRSFAALRAHYLRRAPATESSRPAPGASHLDHDVTCQSPKQRRPAVRSLPRPLRSSDSHRGLWPRP